MAPEVPTWARELEPDLLISSEWAKLPPPKKDRVSEALEFLGTFVAEQRWRRWSVTDWIYALTFASIGLELTRQLVVLAQEVSSNEQHS
jgi:hypothetical protein